MPSMMKERSKPRNQGQGTLYIVATPIGNLEDLTFRAVRVLKEVDLIAAESVQHSRVLCRHYGVKGRLTSYNQHNRRAKTYDLVEKLKSGLNIALITSAGTPGISDPGGLLVSQALKENLPVHPIPGPSAVTAAFSASGMPSGKFLFMGFLSSRAGRRKNELKGLAREPRPMVFFEAPHRLLAMLADLCEVLGNRELILFRELTKTYEEMIRGPAESVLGRLREREIRGEVTLLVSPADAKGAESLSKEARRMVKRRLMEKGATLKDIAERMAEEEGLPYRRVYRECLSIKKTL